MNEQPKDSLYKKSQEQKNRKEQNESMSLVDKAIHQLANDKELMKQYIEKTLDYPSLKERSPKKIMKTMVLLFIEEHYVGAENRDKVMEIFKRIVDDKSEQIFSQLWSDYNTIFPDIVRKHFHYKKKKHRRKEEQDLKKLAGGDKD